MAKVFPERLPESITSDPKRRAESRVYTALKTLPERYTIFYSVHWHELSDEKAAREGEADFIIVHPDMGIVVLEVKGGGIHYKAETNEWFSFENISGVRHSIKDPVDQGRQTHYALLRQLKGLPSWPAGYINIDHAVCFPDVFLNDQSLKPDLSRQIILDSQDLDDITKSVPRLFRALFGDQSGSGAPGSQRMQIIEGYLARSFELKTPLGVEIEYEDQKLVQLTEQQFYALSLLGERKRVAIGGCAGSGKTMLALEKARQFSELDLSVLLVCFNAPLAAYLRKRLPESVDVYHFHELCRQAARQVGMTLPSGADDQEYYDSTLPQALLDAGEEIGRVYDAIIVDEGQDFLETYWIALEPLLKEDGYLMIFFDNNQNLYGGVLEFGGLIQEPAFSLTQNCRNTQNIHNTVARFHSRPRTLHCSGPLGRPPEVYCYHGEDDGQRQLQKTLYRLVVEEHIHPGDIAVLTPRGQKKTRFAAGVRLGNFRLSPQPSTERDVIQATSIYQFKGLEKRVIVLAELDSHTIHNTDMILYVGCSRARTHLVIFHDADAPPELVSRLGLPPA